MDFTALAELDVDLVIGGPPCQDFSVVRGPEWDRKGIEVKRGRLYTHFVRALVHLQPKVFVFENVPGLVSANQGLAYRVILEDFASLNFRLEEVRKSTVTSNGVSGGVNGYEVVFSSIVNFSALGVPQKRERLIIVGVRKDLISKEIVSELRSVLQRAIKLRGVFEKYPLTPIETFEGRTIPELLDVYAEVMKKWEGVWLEVNTSRAWEWKHKTWDKLTFNAIRDYLLVNEVKSWTEHELEDAWRAHEEVLKELGYYGRRVCESPLPDGTCLIPEDTSDVRERMRKIPPDENHEFVRGTKWQVEGRGISLVYRRIHPLKPSNTIVAYGGGGTHGYHYDRDRATLSLRESKTPDFSRRFSVLRQKDGGKSANRRGCSSACGEKNS